MLNWSEGRCMSTRAHRFRRAPIWRYETSMLMQQKFRFISKDTIFGGDVQKITLLTGPNMGGVKVRS